MNIAGRYKQMKALEGDLVDKLRRDR